MYFFSALSLKDMICPQLKHIRKYIKHGLLLPELFYKGFLLRLKDWFRIMGSRWPYATVYFGWIDKWQRYNLIAKEIKQLINIDEKPPRILDVGGADKGNAGALIGEFVNPDHCDLYACDINYSKLIKGSQNVRTKVTAIVGDGCCLPFKNNSFDVVISSDTIEHIPKSSREEFYKELKRVTKNIVILHFPADSMDGTFKGTFYDSKFLKMYQRRFGKLDQGILEHQKYGLPKVEDVASFFPFSIIKGSQNGEAWIKYMVLGWTPYVSLFSGLLYNFFFKKTDKLPPYRSCLLIYSKIREASVCADNEEVRMPTELDAREMSILLRTHLKT